MKALLVCGSLFVNAILVAALVNSPGLVPRAWRDFFAPSGRAWAGTAESRGDAKAVRQAAPKLWTQLDTADLKTLKARLLAAGFPANIVRGIITSLIDAQYGPKIRALFLPDPNTPFWKLRPGFTGFGDERYVAAQQLQRERTKAVRDLTADLAAADADVSEAQRRRFGNLPPEKIQMLQRIEDDYADMTSAIRAGLNGIELPEDKAQLALLAKEKQADLAALLTPDELADYQMRTSPLTNLLRGQLSAFDPSEAEYKAIFQAYQAVGQKFGGSGLAGMDLQSRGDAEQLLASGLKTGLGDIRYDQYLQATSNDYRQVARIAEQQNLPPETVGRVMALRDATAQQSAAIAADTSQPVADRRSALQTLAQNARLQLSDLIPGDAGQSYAKRANWLALLDRGVGVSINPPAPTVIITNDTGGISSYSSSPPIRPIPIRRGHP